MRYPASLTEYLPMAGGCPAGEEEGARHLIWEDVCVKVFRLEEASALLPVLRPLIEDLVCKRRDLAIKLLEAQTAKLMITDTGGAQRAAVQDRQAQEMQAALVALIEQIQSHG